MSIKAAGGLTINNFHACERFDSGDEAVIDLEAMTFIDPFGLVGVACHVLTAQDQGKHVQLVHPKDVSAQRYLERIHFSAMVQGLRVEADRHLPPVRATDQRDSLIELSPFDDYQDVDRLATMVWKKLEGGVDPQVTNALFEAVGEVGNNAAEHSQPGGGGWGIMAAQVYRKGTPEERLLFAVGDVGIGIQASLARRHRVADDGQALEMALKPLVTGTDDKTRGNGLAEVEHLVTSLRGQVVIRSGSAQVTRRSNYAGDPVAVKPMQGTLVGADLPCRPGASG